MIKSLLVLGLLFLLTILMIILLWEYITVINAMNAKLSQIRDFTLLRR